MNAPDPRQVERLVVEIFDRFSPDQPRRLLLQVILTNMPVNVPRPLIGEVIDTMVAQGRLTRGPNNFLTLNR